MFLWSQEKEEEKEEEKENKEVEEEEEENNYDHLDRVFDYLLIIFKGLSSRVPHAPSKKFLRLTCYVKG